MSVAIDHFACWLFRNALLPAGDRIFGQRMMSRLRMLENAQWWSRDRLHEERDRLLRQTVAESYASVPLYRDLMNDAGLTPADLRTPADLQKLPIITKDRFRAGHPHRNVRKTPFKTHEVHTSGSTGKNFAVVEDTETRGWYLSSFLLSLEWAGWKVGQAHMQTGMTLSRDAVRRCKDSLMRCTYVSAFDLDDASVDRALDILDSKKIEHLWGYAASLYYFGLRAKARGWNRPLRSTVTWGDNLYPHFREAIESAFGTKVIDTYGVGEGIQVSAQCEYGNYHVHTLDTIVEYVDDEGQAAPADQAANLILTRLHTGAMPLIRYQVGDMGIRGDSSLCPCGRGFDRMQEILGRDTDIVITPSGNRLIVEFFNGIIDDIPEIDSFQVIQEAPDAILVKIVPVAEWTEGNRRELVDAMLRSGADGLRIDVERVENIRPVGGKRRYVINKLESQHRTNRAMAQKD